MNITGVDFICVPTQDYERASVFYGETLGLALSKRWGDMPAGEFETGTLTIALERTALPFGPQRPVMQIRRR